MVKLVIVEDEHWTRELIKQIVEHSGLKIQIVGEADNGEYGLRLLLDQEADILITDMQMPFKDGVELLKLLEQHNLKSKIIVLSGHDDFIYMRQAIHSGVVEYLLKPVDPDQLKHALQLCIERINQERQSHASYAMVFFPAEVIKIMSTYKKHIQLLLTEHDFDSIHSILGELIGKLDHKLSVTPEQWRRVYQELAALLEEYAELENQELSGKTGGNLGRIVDLHTIQSSTDVFAALSASYKATIGLVADRLKNRKKINMMEVHQYVENHYAEPVSLEGIAHLFFVSKEYLSKTYKVQFSENLMDHIKRLRMSKAKELILDNRVQIKHIASSIGYEDVSYFYKVFKKYYGLSPNSLRVGDDRV